MIFLTNEDAKKKLLELKNMQNSGQKLEDLAKDQLNDFLSAIDKLKTSNNLPENFKKLEEKLKTTIKNKEEKEEKQAKTPNQNENENNGNSDREKNKHEKEQNQNDKDNLDISSGWKCPKGLVKKKVSLFGKPKSMSTATKNVPVILNSYSNYLENIKACPSLSSSLKNLSSSFSELYAFKLNKKVNKQQNSQDNKKLLADKVISDYSAVQNFLQSDISIKIPETNQFFLSKVPNEVAFSCVICRIEAELIKENINSRKVEAKLDKNGNIVIKSNNKIIPLNNRTGFVDDKNKISKNNQTEKNQEEKGIVEKLTAKELEEGKNECGLDSDSSKKDMSDYRKRQEEKNKHKETENPEQEISEEDRANEAYLKELEENGMSLGPTSHTEDDN